MLAPILTLTLTLTLASAPDPDPAVLVARLGSPRFAERERAAAALRDLGSPALPALRAARRDDDPEVRARASALADAIERADLLRPTRIALNFRDLPLSDALKDFGAQARAEIGLHPAGGDAEALGRRVTLDEPDPVPFWTALDKFCSAARLQHHPAMTSGNIPGQPRLQFLTNGIQSPGRVFDDGPFRTYLQALFHSRSITLNPPGPGEPPIVDQFYGQLLVTAEPRLLIGQTAPVTLREAVDDLGQSLAIPPDDPANPTPAAYFHNQGTQFFYLQVYMKYPARPGTRIRALRGKAPVSISSRKDDPAVIPLAGATGKTFRTSDATLIVHELMRPTADGQGPILDLTLQGRDGDTSFEPVNSAQAQIELLDARDRPIPWYVGSSSGSPGHARMVLTRNDPNAVAGPPDHLKFYDVVRAPAEVSFEFRDLPMP